MYQRIAGHNVRSYLSFTLVDLLCLYLAFFAAYFLRFGNLRFYADPLYRNACISLALIHFLVLFFADSYGTVLQRGFCLEFVAVLKHYLLLLFVLLLYLFMDKEGSFSRLVFLYLALVGIPLTYLGRLFVRAALRRFRKKNAALLVAPRQKVAEALLRLQSDQWTPFVGVILSDGAEGDAPAEIEGVPVVCGCAQTLDYIKSHWVDEIFLLTSWDDTPDEALLDGCADMGVTIHLMMDIAQVGDFEGRTVDMVGGYAVLTESLRLAPMQQMVLKRLLDIVGALIGLLITAVVFVIFAPIIVIQSPGPVFFSQKRVGKNGKVFRLYKFRSMYADAEARKQELMAQNKMNGLMFKIDNDPRITPIGRFMRATSLDELPQFWNILKGDMSLVGTRPPTLDEYEKYELHHKIRLAAKPGLTGLWQVSGRSNITDFEEVVALDKQYISQWSIGHDLRILFKTVLIVLRRDGAA